MQPSERVPLAARLPFFFGWVIIAVAFVTVALGATARTAFSLMFPPMISEFGWERGLAAGAFSFGFMVSAVVSPIIGKVMDVRAAVAAAREAGQKYISVASELLGSTS